MNFLGNLFRPTSVADLEEQKQKAIEDYDAKIAAAREKESAATTTASQPGPGTAPSVGGRKKTRRSKKSKSKRSRTGRKSSHP